MTPEMERIVNRDRPTIVRKDLRRYTREAGEMELFEHQSEALAWAERDPTSGLILAMGVGAGKTLTSYLLPNAYGIPADETIIVTSKNLIPQGRAQYAEYVEHFYVEPIRYVTHDILRTRPELLEGARLIIVDEVHKFRNVKAARTKALVKYWERENPIVVVMTATFMEESVRDFAHLLELSHREDCPVPRQWSQIERWAKVLDVEPRIEPGAYDFKFYRPIFEKFGTGVENKKGRREAFREHIYSWPGVVGTHGSSYEGEIAARFFRSEKLPVDVLDAISIVKNEGTTPCGQELAGPAQVAGCIRTLGCGGYYRAKGEVPEEWRKAKWEYEMAKVFGKDTTESFAKLKALKHLRPENEWVTLNPSILENIVDYCGERGSSLIWYRHLGVAQMLENLGIPVAYAGDPVPEGDIVGVSQTAHSYGQHLVHFGHSFVLNPSGRAYLWEQLVGRTARHGQLRDRVEVTVRSSLAPYRRKWKDATRNAHAIQESWGSPQKILDLCEIVC